MRVEGLAVAMRKWGEHMKEFPSPYDTVRLGPSYETDEQFQQRSRKYMERIIDEIRRIRMAVRAKFVVDSYTTTLSGTEELRTIKLRAVYSSDPNSENGKFFKWTPTATIDLGTVNPDAWKQFELGKEYYVDFTAVE